MKRVILNLIFVTLLIISCGQSTTENNIENNSSIASEAIEPNNIYSIKGEEIVIRSGPGNKYDKVINEKLTTIMHKTQYATIDYSVKVKELETKDEWSQIVVVEPEYLSVSHRGWILTKFLIKQDSAPINPDLEKRIALFNNVTGVQNALGNNDIGKLRTWHNDGMSWISSTDYFSFGSSSIQNGMQNNLAYYLESDRGNNVSSIKLVLNINNKAEKSEAISLFKEKSLSTFKLLSLNVPQGLEKCITVNKKFNSENSDLIPHYHLIKVI